MTGTLLLIAIFLPFAGIPLLAFAGKKLRANTGWLALAFPVISALCLIAVASQLSWNGQPHVFTWPWILAFGINLSFLVDGLSLFFGLVVSCMGILVFLYARGYLDDHYQQHNRFYAYLVFFMGAMLGTVFSSNLMLLFVFWELTGIASFLLIGFLNAKNESRLGARMALLITAGTGLCMLAGIVLTGELAGGLTFDLTELLQADLSSKPAAYLNAALVLVLLGAFGKSAQFPFQFWLPNAMAAPTPVSAYLHSATMVKLGVFLTARIFPIYHDATAWIPLVTTIGFTTMALGSLLALLSNDLKGILAYSTVSALGSFIGYYGISRAGAVAGDFLPILNHVFYKGCLFMVVGIVDHCCHERDIRKLGGLGKKMPLTALACLLGAASMAGIPGTMGFISKELLLEQGFHAAETLGGWGGYALACIAIGALLQVAFSLRLFFQVFTGPQPEALDKHFHAPSLLIQISPLILAFCALLFGVLPGTLDKPLNALRVAGLHTPEASHYALWHGLNTALGVSLGILIGGAVLYGIGRTSGWRWANVPTFFRWDQLFNAAHDGFILFSKKVTRVTGADSPRNYHPIILGFIFCAVVASLWAAGTLPVINFHFPSNLVRIFTALGIVVSVLGAILLHTWPAQLVSLGISGFLVSFYYVLYRAPDLALTQILVETASLVLVVVLLARFPRSAEIGEKKDHPSPARRFTNIAVAAAIGLMMCWFTLAATSQPRKDAMGPFFTENTVELAEGANAVNTILVDFRGFDTLGEISVLLIALLGSLGLLMRYRRDPEDWRHEEDSSTFRLHHKEDVP